MYTNSRAKMFRDSRTAPYCECYDQRETFPVPWTQLSGCNCGEERDQVDFGWEATGASGADSSAVVSESGRQVIFHPVYSAGTAVVRGDRPLRRDHQYYWEVKMLSDTYGTDIMVGLGTEKVNVADCQYKFSPVLGEDTESYGLSYSGKVQHGGVSVAKSVGFCKGSLVGVRVDMWRGTLEFYINRKSQGVMFSDLRRHESPLYPMLCSTAAQSLMRLTYAASRPASLLVESARCLAAGLRGRSVRLPPGLFDLLRGHFWMTLPGENFLTCDKEPPNDEDDTVEVTPSVISNMLQAQYMNGYYVDGVERNYRVVVKE